MMQIATAQPVATQLDLLDGRRKKRPPRVRTPEHLEQVALMQWATGAIASAAQARGLSTVAQKDWPMLAMTFVLALVASFASFVPARRSTRIAPVQVLRAE